jgi:hypothetical protein
MRYRAFRVPLVFRVEDGRPAAVRGGEPEYGPWVVEDPSPFPPDMSAQALVAADHPRVLAALRKVQKARV